MVSGQGFYEISLNGTVTNWGSVTFSNPLVCFSDNGTQVCVVGGNNGYVFTLATNTLVQITSSGWNGANTVAFLDGYGIFDWPGTNQYYVSALYDFTTINASNFSAIASSSNNIVAVHVLHQNVWVFGTNSVEIEYDAGNLGFPFARIQGAFIEYGCVAPLSVVSTANTLLWLGNDQQGQGVVWMAQGYQPVRVSTAAIEYALAQYVDLSTASAWTYQEDGHYFYCLNVSGYGTTLVYDISMKQWHERGFWDAQYGRFDQHLAICHTFNFGYHLVGDYRNGNVYRMSPLFYDDNGSVIVRERTAPHMINNLDYIYYTKFQIDMETGVGLDGNPPTADQTPPVMLQISNDGGHTWGLERWSDAGVIGAFTGSNAASNDKSYANNAANASNSVANQVYQQTQTNNQPYITAGQGAVNTLSYLTGTGNQDGSAAGTNTSAGGYGSLLTPFTGQQEYFDPSYQFTLQQGELALQQSAAARGTLTSGAGMQAINNYAQQSALQGYETAYNNYNTNQNNIYSRLSGLSNTGQTANAAVQGAGQNYSNTFANNSWNQANAQIAASQQNAAAINQGAGAVGTLAAAAIGGAAGGAGGAQILPYATDAAAQQGASNAANQYQPAINQNQVTQGQLANQATALTNPYIPQVQQANIAQTQATAANQQATAKQQQIQNMYAQHNLEGMALQNATPDNYPQLLQMLDKSGIDVSNAPPSYDPNFIKQMQAQWVNADQQLKVYETNATAAQQGLTPFNPQNPQGTNQPTFGPNGRPIQALSGPEAGTVLSNSSTIQGAPQVNQNLDEALAILQSGNAYGGSGSDLQMARDKYAIATNNPQVIKSVGANPSKFSNTMQVNNLLGDNVLPLIKARMGDSVDPKSNLGKVLANPSALQDLPVADQINVIKTIKANYSSYVGGKQNETAAITNSTAAAQSAAAGNAAYNALPSAAQAVLNNATNQPKSGWDADEDYVPANQNASNASPVIAATENPYKAANQAQTTPQSFMAELPRGMATSGAGLLQDMPLDIAHKVAIGTQYLTGNKDAAASLANMTPEQFKASLEDVVNQARQQGEGTGIPGTIADIVTDPRNAVLSMAPEAGLVGRTLMGAAYGFTNPAAGPDEDSLKGRAINAGLNAGVSAVLPGAVKLTGTAAQGIGDIIGNTIQGVGNALQKATPEGRAMLAGKMLLNSADNPQLAMQNLQNVPQYVSGSNPLTAEAAQDAGLAKLQQAVQTNPAMFPGGGAQIENTLSRNNLARQNALSDISGNQSDIDMAIKARDAAADVQTKRIFANATSDKVDISGIQQMINDIRSAPGGDSLAVNQAADFAQDRLNSLTNKSPENIYNSFRKDIAGALNGNLKLDKYANAGFAKQQLAAIRDATDDAIENAAPGFQDYMQEYANASKNINQMQTLQDIQNSATGNTPDIRSGVGVLSQPKWSNMINENTLPDLQKTLTPKQLNVLQNVTADLDRGASANNLQLKAGGSPTAQNFSMAQSLGAQLAGKASDYTTAILAGSTMTTSYLVPVPKAQFFDNNGYPLAGGLLYSYAAGTSTPLATYTDATGNTPNTNPVVLDASGRADIWLGPALYKLTLTTSAGSNIWTEDNIQGNGFFNGVLANYWAGLATGTVNAIILTTNPSVSSLIAPVQVSFIAAYTNTGAVTINLDSLGVKNLYKQTSAGVVALTGGELVAGNIYNISYDNTEWQLISGAGSAVYWGGTSGGAANVQTATSTPSFTAYNASIQFSFIAGFTNTGATTININGIGAKNIYKLSSTGPVALTGGELQTGSVYTIIYDGTEFQLQTNNIPAIQQSGYRQNLKGVWGSNTTTGWTANQLMVLNSSLQPTILSSYSQTLNSATSGAGGLDTGTLAASTWYYVYAIYNPTTPATSILMSASATTPTLPSGYTYSALIGVVLTDGMDNPLPSNPPQRLRDVVGRTLISRHQNIFEADFEYGTQPLRWEAFTAGAGTVTAVSSSGGVQMTIGTSATDIAIRQTRPYHRYQPGKTMKMATACNFGGAVTNQRQRVGIFDDGNGIFFEQADPTPSNPYGMYAVYRSNIGGLPFDTRTPLTQWNGDQSIIPTLVWSNIEMIWLEYAWYGAGSLRWGITINGEQYILHQVPTGNNLTQPWSRTANLPARYELRNLAGVASGATFYHYGVSILVEGEIDPQRGFTYSYGMALGTPQRSVAQNTTRYPVLSIQARTMGTQEYTQANAAATSGTTTSLTVTGTPWTAGQWVGKYVNFPGLGGATGLTALITANTTNTLTFQDIVTGLALSTAPAAAANYTIGYINRGQLLPLSLVISSSALCTIELIVSTPTLPVTLTGANFVALSSLGSANSFATRDVSATALTGGEVVYGFVAPSGGSGLQIFDLSNFFPLVLLIAILSPKPPVLYGLVQGLPQRLQVMFWMERVLR
ncbi:unnamed protein product [Sphagnum balticum]